MSSTGIYTVTAPTVGTEYIAPSGFWVIPNNATNVSVEIKSYNSSGVLTSVSSLTAILRNITTSSDASSFTFSSGNEALDTSNNTVNGSNVFAPAGKVASACDHFTLQITSYTGRPYSQIRVRRSGAWVTPTVKVRRSGAWATPNAIYVRRSGAWVQIG